jgi:hypothetical protein
MGIAGGKQEDAVTGATQLVGQGRQPGGVSATLAAATECNSGHRRAGSMGQGEIPVTLMWQQEAE